MSTCGDTEAVTGVVVDSSSWSVDFGASALFYLSDADRLYAGPQFTYSRDSSDNNLSNLDSDTFEFAGLFGAQYSLNDRFGVFGELGLGYSHSSSSSESTGLSNTQNRFATRTAAGVILYF
jgi:hypothetical protein